MAQYRTLRAIGERMGWAPSTVLRRHKLDDFPIYPDWTAWGVIWVTSDELIHRWELKKVMMSQGARLKRPSKQRRKPSYRSYNYRLRDKYRTGNETVRPSPKEENLRRLREDLAKLTPGEQEWIIRHELTPAQRQELGVGHPKVHESPAASQLPEPRVAEQPPKLAPGSNPAPPANRKPGMVRPEGCTCGTSVTCYAH
jgi:hypothetical protein